MHQTNETYERDAIFPKFRKLSIEDLKWIEQVTQHFRPATVFNLTCLMTWNRRPCEISSLNQNIVLKTQGFFTENTFFTLLGETALIDSIDTIFKYLEQTGQEQKLHLIPEDMLRLEPKIQEYYLIEEERGYSNYVYLLEKFKTMANTDMHSHRVSAHHFLREYPNVKIEISEFDPKQHQQIIENVFTAWENSKHKTHTENLLEWQAIHRFYHLAKELPSYIIILHDKEQAAGFCIVELVQQQFIIGHFLKVLPAYRGGEEIIFHEIAEQFFPKGYRYFNTEDDFDIESLRKHKLLLHPDFFIKQYIIHPKRNSYDLLNARPHLNSPTLSLFRAK